MNTVSQKVSPLIANTVSRMLSAFLPAAAKAIYFWYPNLTMSGEATTPAWVERFDELANSQTQCTRITLVKIDTEGLEVIDPREMRRLLAPGDPRLAIACELSPAWHDVADLFSLIKDADFEGEYCFEKQSLTLNLVAAPAKRAMPGSCEVRMSLTPRRHRQLFELC